MVCKLLQLHEMVLYLVSLYSYFLLLLLQMARLNEGLSFFDAILIVPMFQIAWTFFSICTGFVYFQEYQVLSLSPTFSRVPTPLEYLWGHVESLFIVLETGIKCTKDNNVHIGNDVCVRRHFFVGTWWFQRYFDLLVSSVKYAEFQDRNLLCKFSGAEAKDNSSLVSVMSSSIPKDVGRYNTFFAQFKK